VRTRVTLSLALRYFILKKKIPRTNDKVTRVNSGHMSLWLWDFLIKKVYIFIKKIVKKKLRANDKVTRVQELTFFLNSNRNLTEGTKMRLKKNLKNSNNLFFS